MGLRVIRIPSSIVVEMEQRYAYPFFTIRIKVWWNEIFATAWLVIHFERENKIYLMHWLWSFNCWWWSACVLAWASTKKAT